MSAFSQSSNVLTSSEVSYQPRKADFNKQSRPKSTSKAREDKRNRVTVDTLNDLAKDPCRIPEFASSLILRSKSAKFFDEELVDSSKESKKQAWAPKPKHNLASSSTKFQRHGRTDTATQKMMEGKLHAPKEFGRVR